MSRWKCYSGSLLLVFSACSTPGSESETVAIGVALNPQRPGMHTVYRGVELAVAKLNTERRASARPFVVRRTPPDLTGAIQVATLLRDDASVVGVVGHPESGTTLDAAPIYEDAEHAGANAVVAVSPTATSPAVSGASRWVFRVCPSDIAVSRSVARYVTDSLRARRVSIIYRNDAYGRDWAKSFAAAYRERGGAVVQRDPYQPGATEWEAYALYVKQLGSDVVLFPGGYEDAAPAIRALRAARAYPTFLGGDAVSGIEREGGGSEFAGVKYAAFFDPARAETPEARAFIEAYQRLHKEPPDHRAALAYDAAMLIGRAALEVGPDRRKVRDYIEQVGRQRPAMKGVVGILAFDEKHDVVNRPIVIHTVGEAPPPGAVRGGGQ